MPADALIAGLGESPPGHLGSGSAIGGRGDTSCGALWWGGRSVPRDRSDVPVTDIPAVPMAYTCPVAECRAELGYGAVAREHDAFFE
jgi:hypothetical protein